MIDWLALCCLKSTMLVGVATFAGLVVIGVVGSIPTARPWVDDWLDRWGDVSSALALAAMVLPWLLLLAYAIVEGL